MGSVNTDRNLLFGVMALQGDLIDSAQFAEGCTAWTSRKDRSLAEVLMERGWISQEDRRLIEELLERKLRKHSGNTHQSLMQAAADSPKVCATIAGLRASAVDPEVQQSLAEIAGIQAGAQGFDFLATISPPRESRDRYTLTSLHAKGGLGQVWLARDTNMDREVALKELRPERTDSKILQERFLREARITGRLDHPGVVPVYELSSGSDQEDQRPYYTMRFIRGRTLSQAVADYHRKLAAKEARRVDLLALVQAFLGVCDTVSYAHSRGVIHRDLKGSNIVLGEFGEVILLDWGLAKQLDGPVEQVDQAQAFDPEATRLRPDLAEPHAPGLTAAGEVLGTPAFMAPEQAEGRLDQIGPRTDVYGLGAILYELLTGKPPFDGTSTNEVLRKVREEPPVPPRKVCRSAPRDLQAICLKALAKKAADRYDSVAALATDVRHWLVDEPVSAWREPWYLSARRWMSRHRMHVAIAAGVLVVAVVTLGTISAMQARSNRALQAALSREEIAHSDAYEQSQQANIAINSFYSGISEDVILRRPELAALREKLLRTALGFYERQVNYLKEQWRNARPGDMQTIVSGLDRIASLQALLGDREAAIRTRRQVVDLFDKSPEFNPEIGPEAVLNLGNLQRLAGKPRDAVDSLREALRRYQVLEPPREGKIALVSADLGRLLFDVGESSEAHKLLENARQIQERLAAPKSRETLYLAANLAATYTTLGNVYEAENQLPDAVDIYRRSETIYKDLRQQLPDDAYYRAEHARSLNNVGLSLAATGNVEQGRRDVDDGLKLREALLAGQPLNVEYRADLARSDYHLARVESLAGDKRKAQNAITQAQALYKDIPPKGPEDLYFQACLKALSASLGAVEDASSQADEAVRLLKQAAAAGYSNPLRYANDPPLETLRSREDFQELVRSLSETGAKSAGTR